MTTSLYMMRSSGSSSSRGKYEFKNNKKLKSINVYVNASNYISSFSNVSKNIVKKKYDKFHFKIKYKYYSDSVETRGKFLSNNFKIIDKAIYKISIPIHYTIIKVRVFLRTKKYYYKFDYNHIFDKISKFEFSFKNGEKYPMITVNEKHAQNREKINMSCNLF